MIPWPAIAAAIAASALVQEHPGSGSEGVALAVFLEGPFAAWRHVREIDGLMPCQLGRRAGARALPDSPATPKHPPNRADANGEWR